MRHSIVLQASALALILGWAQSQAAEGKYPAAHFEPKVIYQATDATPEPTVASDSDFPAAYFEPKVIYQDQALIEAIGPQQTSQTETAKAREPSQTRAVIPRKTKPAGPVSDATPPYGILAFALGLIGLAFWWSTRERVPEAKENAPEGREEATAEMAEAEASAASDDTEEADELEELAEEAEASLAHTNRQRANKSRRVRRR